jgi:hypothetical protein
MRAWFASDGRRVVTASQDDTARGWDAVTGEPVTAPIRQCDWRLVSLAPLHPDGQRLLTASRGRL